MAAGLGSSAAATVAGLRVFERVTRPLPDDELLALATEARRARRQRGAGALRRPDLGGCTTRSTRPGGVAVDVARRAAAGRRDARRSGWPRPRRARRCPTMLPRRDAIFNLQRVLSLVHALQTRDYERLREAVRDRWHQPARAALVPLLARGAGARGSRRARRVPVGRGTVGGRAGAARTSRGVEQLLVGDCTSVRACRSTVRTLEVHQSLRSAGRRGVRAWENRMKFVAGLTCHLCGATYPPKALWVCSECLGPARSVVRLRRDPQA